MSETLFDLSNRYIDRLNASILPRIDYIRLQQSYGTEEKTYVKGILNLLHKAAAEVYGREHFTEADLESGPLVLPAVLDCADQSVCLGLVTIEKGFGRTDTDFFTQYGLVLGSQTQPAEIKAYLWEHYLPTTYALTMEVPSPDSAVPTGAVRNITETFRSYEAELLPRGQQGLIEPEEERDEEIR